MQPFDLENTELNKGKSGWDSPLGLSLVAKSKYPLNHFLPIILSPLTILADINSYDTMLFGIGILVVFLVLFGVFIFGVWVSRAKGSLSPYSRQPMRKGEELSYDSKVKVLRYVYDMHQYDNRIFELKRAAICRETGRVFPDAITWYGVINVDWTFLKKRYPGNYVSWGSLTLDQQELVRSVHDSMKGFQVDFSSPTPQPKGVEAKYAFAKPGPLYVDLNTKVLIGWKCVPRSDLEVLIVQKPDNLILIGSSVNTR